MTTDTTQQLFMGTALGKAMDNRTYLKVPELIDNDTRIGVEVELEQVQLRQVPHHADKLGLWEIAQDSSLRGSNAFEFKFGGPLFGKDAVLALTQLEDTMLMLEEAPLCSERTSVHIHVDVRNLSVKQFTNLVLLYCATESLLLNFCAPHRRGSIYAMPWYMASAELSTTARGLTNLKKSRVWDVAGSKYSALNLEAMNTFGSVEFRMLEGTWNKATILNWVNILLSIRRAASIVQLEGDAILDDITTVGIEKFMRSVFGDTYFEMLHYSGFEQDVERGILLGKDILHEEDLQGGSAAEGEMDSPRMSEGSRAADQMFRYAVAAASPPVNPEDIERVETRGSSSWEPF